MTRSRRILLPLAAAAIAVILAVGLAELGVRLFMDYVPRPDEHEQARHTIRYRPAILTRHVIDPRTRIVKSFGYDIRINTLGYRGDEFAPQKPDGTIRVMVYGGSSVFDPTNPIDWPHRLQGDLREAGFGSIEVINAGVPGHASFDALGRLLAEGHRFSPDYVVLYGGWNDIKYFRQTRSLLRTVKPYTPSLDPRVNYAGSIDEFLANQSQLYVRLRAAWLDWWLDIGPEGQRPQEQPSSDFRPEGPRQFKIIVDTFVDLVRNIGAVPVLVSEARLPAPGNSPADMARIAYDYVALTPEGLLAAYAAVDRTLAAVAAEKGVALIDASALMTGNSAFFADHVHLTEAGSVELARIVADGLERLLAQTAPVN